MKTVKVNFLGNEYSIQCEDNEVAKIKNLESRLKNRVNQYSKKNYNFTDTHKLLIAALSLEDQINDYLFNNKKLIEDISNLKKENIIILEKNKKYNQEIRTRIESISNRIKMIMEKILEHNIE